jgi:glycosyltransferase involved in cell wall biosynthesis
MPVQSLTIERHPSNLVQDPLVSVIVPAYNAERFIEQTLRSVINQTYRNLEIIVVDDGSQDATAEIVRQLGQQDHRIRCFQQRNSGVAAARNLGIQQAQGTLIAPLDADDLWHPQNLEKQVECLLQAPASVGAVYAWSRDIDAENLPLPGFHAAKLNGWLHSTLLAHNFIGNASSTLIRRDALLQVGGYSEQFYLQNIQGCEDWDLYLRLAEKYEFRVMPEILVGYRKLAQSMSDDFVTMARSHLWMLRSQQERNIESATWLYRLSRSSFYLYFAHHNHKRHPRLAIFWALRALNTDLTPLLRPGFYWLLLRNGWQVFWEGDRQTAQQSTCSKHPKGVQGSLFHLSLSLKVKLWFKVLISALLHQCIQINLNLQSPRPYQQQSLTKNQWI